MSFIESLLAAFFGALFASLGVWGVAFWQLNRQRQAERDQEAQLVQLARGRVEEELRANQRSVEELINALDQIPDLRVDLLTWGVEVGDALQFNAYDDLCRSGLLRGFPADVQRDMHQAYRRLYSIRSSLRQIRTHFQFRCGYGGGTSQVEERYEEFKLALPELNGILLETIAELDPGRVLGYPRQPR